MPFPKQTLAWAKDLASSLQLDNIPYDAPCLEDLPPEVKGLRKKTMAFLLYEGLGFKYGFEDSLVSGNWVPWPHELKSVTCYSQAVANFAVAKACGLEPLLVEFIGVKKEEDLLRSGHSTVVINVGENEPEYWVIDQSWGIFGPITIDVEEKSMTVEDILAKPERTHRLDYKIKKFEFIHNLLQDEEDIIHNMNLLQSNPEAVLYLGQRISIPQIDTWQSEKPLESPWFVRYTPQFGGEKASLVSRIFIIRPGIKNRGLEYRIVFDDNTNDDDQSSKLEERVIGYYCDKMVWASFTQPIPMVDLPAQKIVPLLEGLLDIPLAERYKFETQLMAQSISAVFTKTDNPRLAAARESFANLQESEFGGVVKAFSTVEALYQAAKNGQETYLSNSERNESIQKLKLSNWIFAYFSKDLKYLKRANKLKEKYGVEISIAKSRGSSQLLRTDQREDPETRRYLNIESVHEMLTHIVNKRATYLNDALDRLIFYHRKIKGRENKIYDFAGKTFGDNFEPSIFGGYVRIFAEFLGHFASTYPQLSLEKYKPKIIEKIRK